MPDDQPRRPDDHAAGAAGAPENGALTLCGARLADGRVVDVRVCGGRIEAVGTAGSLTAPGARLDLRGHLLLPAPAEPHAHGDTALTAGLAGPASGRPEDIQRRATEAALLQLGHGATALRAHVRIGGGRGLAGLEAVLRAGRSLRGLVELTVVAVPGPPSGADGVAGADVSALLRDALRAGADAVGGCPDPAPDPSGYAEAVLTVAAEHGCPADLHTDGGDPALLARLAASAAELRQGVAIGPCAGLARLPADTAARLADRLAGAGVAVAVLPQGACADAADRGTAPVRLLRAAGVRVAAGSGALRDPANPVGRGDPLEAAFLLASQGGLSPADAYAAVSEGARHVLGLPEVRVEAGFPAELLAVRGEGIADALSQAYSRIVVHRGRVVARTSAVREYGDAPAAGRGPGLPRQGRPESTGGA
ncbi:hydrolase [Streptomyces sp. NBC_00525]|uniref:hydrolase n=1 Tax=Streptomyces sp. NBC_00525 TaxID=2903660 RepID=UPI002E813649|nr:hydrolase [Streptomyces sp. NBC_00525]WUC95343.1 hydrolase [Streptomyces sp. NBC_00525]